MIKALIFDAFGTLFKVTAGNSANAIKNIIKENGFCIDEAEFAYEWKTYYKEKTSSQSGFLCERDIFISRIQMFYDRYDLKRSAMRDFDSLISSLYSRKVYEEVPEALYELAKHYKIFIGSNTDNDVLEAVMRSNNITVDKVYTSENLKCYKPDVRFYQALLDANNLKPNEVVFLGDSITDDVWGPQQLNIKTALIDRNGTYNSDIRPDMILRHIPTSL